MPNKASITVGGLSELLAAFPSDAPVAFVFEGGCAESAAFPTLTWVEVADNGYVYPTPRVEIDVEGL